jgi:RNA polymerase sigma-70 factor, ECF subfamily
MSVVDRTEEFVRLLTANSRGIYTYIRALVPRQADADDIFQETSAVLWRKFGDFQAGTAFRKWAMSVASFEVRQFRRENAAKMLPLDDVFYDVVDRSLQEHAGRLDIYQAAMEACLQQLAPKNRALLSRRFEQDVTVSSLAAESGRSTWSVYRLLSKLYQTLYQCVTRRMATEDET